MSAAPCHEKTCALRAPTASLVRIKNIRTKDAVLINGKDGLGFYTRSPISHGWLYHPCEIDDPRGQRPSAQN